MQRMQRLPKLRFAPPEAMTDIRSKGRPLARRLGRRGRTWGFSALQKTFSSGLPFTTIRQPFTTVRQPSVLSTPNEAVRTKPNGTSASRFRSDYVNAGLKARFCPGV